MNPHTVLGVAPDADLETIKAAYRRRAAETHPDRSGGDAEAFRAVRAAWEQLSDPQWVDPHVLAALKALCVTMIDECQPHHNLVQVALDEVATVRRELARRMMQRRKRRERLLSLQGRVGVAHGPDVFAAVLEDQLVDVDADLDAMAERMNMYAAMEEYMAGWSDGHAEQMLVWKDYGGGI